MNSIAYEDLISRIATEFTNNPLENKKWDIAKGRKNRIVGYSGQPHQIDISLECDTDLLLIECKKWNNRITVSEYLVLFGRLYDISQRIKGKRVRAALVTSTMWQSGVEKLNSAYGRKLSLFHVNSVGEVLEKVHTAFISASIRGNSNVTGNLRNRNN